MAKPVKPTTPVAALRSDPTTFAARAEDQLVFMETHVDYMDEVSTYNDALATALLTQNLPPLDGKAGDVVAVNDAEDAVELIASEAHGRDILASVDAATTRGLIELPAVTDDVDLTVDPDNIALRGNVDDFVKSNIVSDEYTASTAISSNIPPDNTIPQNTEGAEILSVTITPRRVTSKIRLTVSVGTGSTSDGTSVVTLALFKDSDADAFHASSTYNTDNDTLEQGGVRIYTIHSPATTSPITYKVRVGANSGDVTFNNIYGGVSACTLIAEEILQ